MSNTVKRDKNYRSNVAQSLKSFNPQHPAIKLVNLSTEEFRELNDAQLSRLRLFVVNLTLSVG